MNFEIVERYTGRPVFAGEYDSFKDALVAAMERDIPLSGLDLSNKSLRGMDFSRVNIDQTSFKFSDLAESNFFKCYLTDCDFESANISDSSLLSSTFRSCHFRNANIDGVDLNFVGLPRWSGEVKTPGEVICPIAFADTSRIRDDFMTRISGLNSLQLIELYRRVLDGKFARTPRGVVAWSGFDLGKNLLEVRGEPVPFSYITNRVTTPHGLADYFLYAIQDGDTPGSNPVSHILSGWIEEFAKANDIKLPTRSVVWS